MADKIRVIRVMEYEYDSIERMDRDMANWAVSPTGVKKFNNWQTIRSTILVSPVVEDVTDANSPT